MPWQTPKTNWGVDGVGSNDFNRIEGNISVLHRGNGYSTVIYPNSSYNLDINDINDVFLVETSGGNNQIARILTQNRDIGNKLYLINNHMSGGYYLRFLFNYSPSGNYKPILSNISQLDLYPKQALLLVYNGSSWVYVV